MKLFRMALTLAVALALVGTLSAGEGKKGKKAAKPAAPPQVFDAKWLDTLNLDAKQKDEVEKIAKEFAPKLAEAMKKGDVFTPEQKKARGEAMKKAKEEGKKGKDAEQMVKDAVKVSDQQQKDIDEAKKEIGELRKRAQQELMSLLTPEQKELIKKKKGEKKGEKKAETKPADAPKT